MIKLIIYLLSFRQRKEMVKRKLEMSKLYQQWLGMKPYNCTTTAFVTRPGFSTDVKLYRFFLQAPSALTWITVTLKGSRLTGFSDLR